MSYFVKNLRLSETTALGLDGRVLPPQSDLDAQQRGYWRAVAATVGIAVDGEQR